MRTYAGPRIDATILGTASLLALAMSGTPSSGGGPVERFELAHPAAAVTVEPALAGTWRSTDRAVKLRLGTDGSYSSSVAGRKRAARGTYLVDGTVLHLRDDSGLRIDATVAGDVLDLAGHRLLKI